MEFIIELILELLFEFGVDATQNKKVPKFIRILLITIILLVFISIISLIIIMGILIIKKELFGGIIIILIGLIMLVLYIVKFSKMYLLKKRTKIINYRKGGFL